MNRFFYPDHSATSELLSDLAFTLSRRGLEVAVITSRLRYDEPDRLLPPHESIDGVEVWRTWTTRQGRQLLLGRLLDYASFYLAAGWRLWRVTRRGNVVVSKTDPPLLSVVAACITWLRGAKLINWHQDIFPELAEALDFGGPIGRAGFALLRLPRNWSLRRARFNVVVGNTMAERMRQFGVPAESIRQISNWADGERIRPIDPCQNSLRFPWLGC